MAITRINNNQITDSVAGNLFLGVNAAVKIQDFTVTAGKIANNLTYNSDLTVTGNLTVQGNTTAIDTINLVVEDPLILLAKEQTGAPALDIGFIGKRGTEDNIAFVWDEDADQFVAVFTTSEVTNSTISINSYASLQVLDLTAANANITGNLTFNGSILGNVDVTGNITGGNLISDAAIEGVTITASGNLEGNNAVITNDVAAATVTASGNVSAGNLTTAGVVVATGNVTGGNLTTAGAVIATGNIDGGNVNATSGITAGTTVIATGNVSGGNITTAGVVESTGNVIGGNITTAGVVAATGNVSGGNITTAGVVVATGNVSGGNIITAGDVDASGNVLGDNAIFTGDMQSNTIHTTGNALIGGNLIVQGNLSYNNVEDLRIVDPIIIMGTGANGTPPIADDGQDRGIFMEYYSTDWANAFVGWDRSANSIIAATSVNFSANNVVNVLEYGPFTAGNANLQSATATGNISGGNITTAGLVEATGNVIGGNINATANVTGQGAVFSGNVTAANFIGNISGNIDAGGANTNIQFNDDDVLAGSAAFTFDKTSNLVTASGNISAGNLVTAGVVESTGNVSGGNLTTGGVVTATGNVSGGNITTAGDVTTATVTASGNISGGNLVTTGTADLGNIRITGDDITNFASNIITINSAASDIDVRISGDTVANLLVTDAGTDSVLIGGGNATVGTSFKVDTTDSMMPPVGNTAQRPGSPVIGMFRFNTGGDALEVYTSGGWEDVGVPAFTVIVADAFVGDGSTVAFTLSANSTTAGTVVAINGVVQEPTTAYSVSGVTLTFTEAPAVSDNIDARIFTTTTTVRSIENSSANAVVAVSDTADTVEITGNVIPQTSNVYNLGSNALRWNELFLQGSTITLGNVVIKNTSGNTIGFFGPDGSTAGSIDTNNIDSAGISNGTSSLAVITSGGNIRANVGGSTVGVFSSTGLVITGSIEATNGFIGLDASKISNGTSNVSVIASNGNVDVNVGGSPIVTFYSGGIDNRQSNGVGNIGTASSQFNTIFAKATSAQYADLAEMYEADAVYEPGTVLCFGGAKEVTLCGQTDSTRVAGVVSTNPSYLMNSGQTGDNVVAVALTGRVPCKVTGTIRKGDLIVSAGDGRARANNSAAVGTVIGKALADFDGADGVIEVVVGRV